MQINNSNAQLGVLQGPATDGSPTYIFDAVHKSGESARVRQLFETFNEAGVTYCHWKSNVRLGETMAGEQDIDVLFDRCDSDRIISAIGRCQFKLAVAHRASGHPSVFHALGLDEDLGRLVDLHGYYQLVSGDSFVKRYRFPFDRDLLREGGSIGIVRVPAPEQELLLFLIRTALKHTSAIEILKVNRKYKKTQDELRWLLERCDRSKLDDLYRSWFPTLGMSLEALLEATHNSRSLMKRVSLGIQASRALRAWRRLGPVSSSASRLWRVSCYALNHLTARKDQSLMNGGAWIALVGPKGSGKSTLANLIARRFGEHLDVRRVHFGKPPPSLISLVPRAFVPLARKLLPNERLSEYEKADRRAGRQYSMFYILRMLLLAWDRRLLVASIMRAVAAGTVVISDRCAATNAGGMDGSAFDELAIIQAKSSLKRWLMQKERQFYFRLPRPGFVLRLNVPMSTAMLRDQGRKKPGGPNPDAITRRWEREANCDYQGSKVLELQADGALESTLRSALAQVWKEL